MQRYGTELSRTIVSAVGAQSVRSIFAAGSVASGEVASFDAGGELEIFSDIDLYVILADGVDDQAVRSEIAAAVARFQVEYDAGAIVVESPDVGVYTALDFKALPPRPGTAALAAGSAMLLHGDESVLSLRAAEQPIARGEALYLLENRLSEMRELPEPSTAIEERRQRFRIIKTIIDTGTAALISVGAYHPRLQDRMAHLRRETPRCLDERDVWLLEQAHNARMNLQAFLPLGTAGLGRGGATDLALRVWKRIAVAMYKKHEWADLVFARCRQGDYAHNLRTIMAVCRRHGKTRPQALRSGVHLSRFDPTCALRLYGLVVSLRELEPNDAFAPYDEFLDRLTAACGYLGGALAERCAAMFRTVR